MTVCYMTLTDESKIMVAVGFTWLIMFVYTSQTTPYDKNLKVVVIYGSLC